MAFGPITAARVVPAAREDVFAFLAEGQNHWQLGGHRIVMVDLAPPGAEVICGTLLMRGPLGIRRLARTRVTSLVPPEILSGVAELSGGTCSEVCWRLEEVPDGTNVLLRAQVVRASPADRILLMAGGTVWMRRAFAATLRCLESQLVAAAFASPRRPAATVA